MHWWWGRSITIQGWVSSRPFNRDLHLFCLPGMRIIFDSTYIREPILKHPACLPFSFLRMCVLQRTGLNAMVSDESLLIKRLRFVSFNLYTNHHLDIPTKRSFGRQMRHLCTRLFARVYFSLPSRKDKSQLALLYLKRAILAFLSFLLWMTACAIHVPSSSPETVAN